jgi:succinyl-CoA synthetase alpha subunit
MSIFLNENSKVIVQGITGGEGTKHSTKMLAAGTNIVGGVNARKAGTSVSIGGKDLTVFGTVEEADEGDRRRRQRRLRAAEVRQGRRHRGDRRRHRAGRGHHRGHPGARLGLLLGARLRQGQRDPDHRPELPGIISPGKSNAGIIPADIAGPAGSAWCPSRAR